MRDEDDDGPSVRDEDYWADKKYEDRCDRKREEAHRRCCTREAAEDLYQALLKCPFAVFHKSPEGKAWWDTYCAHAIAKAEGRA